MIRVSASALDILWSDLRLPGSPAPLAVRSVGETRDERARIRDEVYANLADRGLFRGGELDPAFVNDWSCSLTLQLVVECEALIDLSDPSRCVRWPWRPMVGVSWRCSPGARSR